MISFLDTDYYTFTVGQVVFNQFSETTVKFEFISRDNLDFPEGFDVALLGEIRRMSRIGLESHEIQWLKDNCSELKEHYIEWLTGYRFNPKEVEVTQKDGKLSIIIEAPWRRALMWEVPLLATISQLYNVEFSSNYRYDPIKNERETIRKCCLLEEARIKWSDFGTRRRYSSYHHLETLKVCRNYQYFQGTSNLWLAKRLGLKPKGTMSHQGPMAMQAIVPLDGSNSIWAMVWNKEYKDKLKIFLPDTLTTNHLIRQATWNNDSDNFYLSDIRDIFRYWDGFRQDSGCPHEFINKIVKKYRELGINPKDKKIICSDRLTAEKLIAIAQAHPEINIEGGIGTDLTGLNGGLNIVIKMTQCNGKNVVKLSDNIEKATGNSGSIQATLDMIK